jgi:beta-phosphoglucomutase
MFKYILFDMDGVLLDSALIHENSYLETFSHFDIKPSFCYEEIAGRTTIEVMTEISTQCSLDSIYIQELVKKKQMLVQEKFNQLGNAPLFPGTKSSLELVSKKYKLALCTSASRLTVQAFFRSGIPEHLFECILSAENVLKGKPDPEIYLHAMCLLGADPTECVIVEDSISGILAGIASGAKVLHVGKRDSINFLPDVYLNKVKSFGGLEAMTQSLVCI